MGSEEPDITQISLQLEGRCISITRTRLVTLGPEPLHTEPGVGSTPTPKT